MLIHSGLLTEFLKCLKAQRWTTGMRWYDWNEKTNYVRLKTRPYLISFLFCSFFTICRLLKIFAGVNKERNSSGILTYIGIIFTLIPLTVGHYSFEMVRYNNTVEKLFMGLASFEERYCSKGRGKLFIILKAVMSFSNLFTLQFFQD